MVTSLSVIAVLPTAAPAPRWRIRCFKTKERSRQAPPFLRDDMMDVL